MFCSLYYLKFPSFFDNRVIEAEEREMKAKNKTTDVNRRLDQALSALQELGQENQNIQVNIHCLATKRWKRDCYLTKDLKGITLYII